MAAAVLDRDPICSKTVITANSGTARGRSLVRRLRLYRRDPRVVLAGQNPPGRLLENSAGSAHLPVAGGWLWHARRLAYHAAARGTRARPASAAACPASGRCGTSRRTGTCRRACAWPATSATPPTCLGRPSRRSSTQWGPAGWPSPWTASTTAWSRCRRPTMTWSTIAPPASSSSAFGLYVQDPQAVIFHATGMLVLTLAGDSICAMTGFDTSSLPQFGLPRTLPG